MKKNILVVDDHQAILKLFEKILSADKYHVTTCLSGVDAIQKLNQQKFDLVISDLTLPKVDALQLLTHTQKLSYYVPVIVITGHGSIESAVQALKAGAFDFLRKPFSTQQVMEVIHKALQDSELHADWAPNIQEQERDAAFKSIIARSDKMQQILQLIEQVATTSATVLIQGESGTGKELIARAIHNLSERKNASFVALNCGALSETLLENELFGHVKGAFTGASNLKTGLLKVADKGTVFLDEIGDVTPTVQTKLLRVLQEREFIPLGGHQIVKVDVRLIAATNVDLKEAIREKRFREDLYYRLAVIPIVVPPLRERKEDIPVLAVHFLKKYSQMYNKGVEKITPEAIEYLQRYDWPGNVRELENIIERSVALCSAESISPEFLSHHMSEMSIEPGQEIVKEETQPFRGPITAKLPLKVIINRVTKDAIIKALKKTKGNRSQAANLLGIGRASLYHKLKEYGLEEYKEEKEEQ